MSGAPSAAAEQIRQERDRFEALSPYEQASRLFAVASGAGAQGRQVRA